MYRGQGYVPGIPARDLTPEEVEQYGGVDLLRNARIWDFVPVEGTEEAHDG